MESLQKTKYNKILRNLYTEHAELEEGEKLLIERKNEIRAMISEIHQLKKEFQRSLLCEKHLKDWT